MTTAIATYPSLRDRVVLITGGGSGIGAAITRRFAGQHAKVAFIDIADGPSKDLVAELKDQGHTVHYEHCDLKDIEALRRSIGTIREALGPITILINNAAHDERHADPRSDPRVISTTGSPSICGINSSPRRPYCPTCRRTGGGSIVNFGSVSWMAGQGGMAVYTAAKSAVLGLTRSLARDYGQIQRPGERDRAGLDHDRAAAVTKWMTSRRREGADGRASA